MTLCTDQYAPLGDVGAIEETPSGLRADVGEERLCVDVLGPDLLRLKISQGGRFDERFRLTFRGARQER